MAKHEVTLHQLEARNLYGVWGKSNDKTIAKDIAHISQQYYQITKKEKGNVLPFFVLSKDYNPSTQDFALFVGSVANSNCLESAVLPQGLYAKITVKPKFGFLWGLAIGEAKRFFYTQWLPTSDYKALNLEYEHHTQASIGRLPAIDILFAVTEKTL